MGSTQADFEGLQLSLNGIRFGPRIVPREHLNVPYQGVRPEQQQKPTRKAKEPKLPPDPGYGRFQQRLPGF